MEEFGYTKLWNISVSNGRAKAGMSFNIADSGWMVD